MPGLLFGELDGGNAGLGDECHGVGASLINYDVAALVDVLAGIVLVGAEIEAVSSMSAQVLI